MKPSPPASPGTGRDERWVQSHRALARLTASGERGARSLGELRDLKRRDVLPADINPAVARLQAKLQALERDPQRLEAAARQLASAPAARQLASAPAARQLARKLAELERAQRACGQKLVT